MSEQESNIVDLSSEEMLKRLAEVKDTITRVLTKDLPRDMNRIKSAAPTPEGNQRAIHSTVLSYIQDQAQAIQVVVDMLDLVAVYMEDSTDWCGVISDHIDSIDDRVSDLDGGGDTIIGQEEYKIMMGVAVGCKLLASENLKNTTDEQGKNALAQLILECDQQIAILKDAVITDDDDMDDAPMVDPENLEEALS